MGTERTWSVAAGDFAWLPATVTYTAGSATLVQRHVAPKGATSVEVVNRHATDAAYVAVGQDIAQDTPAAGVLAKLLALPAGESWRLDLVGAGGLAADDNRTLFLTVGTSLGFNFGVS